jgi:hypothetical protein
MDQGERVIMGKALDAAAKLKVDKPEVNRVEQLPDDELIEVTVIKNHKHTVGPNTYEYRAMEPTTVPKQVAEVLKESGLLYEGGIAGRLVDKIVAQNKKTKKPVEVAPVSEWEDEQDG